MRRTRIYIILILTTLLGIGVVMVYSSSSIYAWNNMKDSAFFLKKHLIYLLFGFVLMFAAMAIDHDTLKKIAKPLFLISLFLLFLSLVPGLSREVSGAKRWIKIGGLGFQPSELIKLTFIIYLADFISRRKDVINNVYYGILPSLIVLGVPILLILLQPDLGTAISLVGIAFIMWFCAGMSYNYFLLAGLMSLPALYFLIFRVAYRRARILSFLNPWADPKGAGFQIIQSQIALGSGGLFGQGLGQGKQKLFYLPAAHTDFIFSVIAEEMGIIGAAVVVLLFILLIWQMIKIVRYSNDDFFRFLSIGIVSLISIQVVVNIGVSTGMFPTKGLPLPFISYGGSSLVFDMAAMGLLLNASRKKEVFL
ncbi:MAG: putative lipid II flippase FtsW [Candidatus Omnitrophica bacterium]|nr:putative lipid II flippase FtsW [Candidatus Omnitrophota bacterium]MDD5355249.1 putative lipid II flippase FtsW [Candidatus Omnitrophota bacterium]